MVSETETMTAVLMVAIVAAICLLALSYAMDCPEPRQQLVQSFDYQTQTVGVRPVITCEGVTSNE